MPHILEQEIFTHPGRRQFDTNWVINEDRVVMRANKIWAVIDGETALKPLTRNDMNTSEYTAQWLHDALLDYNYSTDDNAISILNNLDKKFGEHLKSEWPEAFELSAFGPRCTVALLRLHGNGQLSWAQCSDSYMVIEFKDNSLSVLPRPLPYEETDAPAQDAIAAHIKAGMPVSEAKNQDDVKKLDDLNRVISQKRVFDGHTEITKSFLNGTCSADSVKSVLLASDGFFIPTANQSFDENAVSMLRSVQAYGLGKTWKDVCSAFDADPNGATYPRFKHMDDASGAMIRFG